MSRMDILTAGELTTLIGNSKIAKNIMKKLIEKVLTRF